jgi:hypothetical protein
MLKMFNPLAGLSKVRPKVVQGSAGIGETGQKLENTTMSFTLFPC